MAAIFSQILNMSMTGSVVILLVILARLILKRSPKIFSYALWSVVLFRLLCPVAFTAPISVLDVVEPEQKETSNNTSIVTYIPATIDTQTDFIAVQTEEQQVLAETVTESDEQLHMTPMHAVALVWAAGMAGMMLYSVIQYLALRRKLVGSVQLKGNIYQADHIDTAFVVGLVQPRIYLPSAVPHKERYFILAHEQHHIRRGDHIIKLLAYLALCIHWFNPLVWLAFILAGKDMEMSCDEAVIKRLGPEIRADYSASLLRLATHKKILSGMPLAFGEGDTKGRVLNMAKWKKPAKWLVAICVVLCLIVVCICAFNPEKEIPIEELTRQTSEGPVDTAIGDLCFTYPGGLTSETRDVDNWNEEDKTRSRRDLPTRRPHNHFFIDNGVDFGGVVDFILPESRQINIEEMNLPTEWQGLDYIAGSSSYPYAEMEYTLIKDGKDHIQLYLYTYSGRGYFLWFYTEQGYPAHKESILKSVELGSFSTTATKLKRDEIVSLGQFNMTILKGYGYHRNENIILEITRKERFGEQVVVGCVTARPNPNLPLATDADWVDWVEAVGLDLHLDDPNYGYTITDNGEFGDISLTLEEMSDKKRLMSERHYFYIAGDLVYHLWFDAMEMNLADDKQMLQSIWIKESYNNPSENNAPTTVGIQQPMEEKESYVPNIPASDRDTDMQLVSYGSLKMLLPSSFATFEDGNIVVLTKDSVAVGGIRSWNYPEFQPSDIVTWAKEEHGVPVAYMSSSSAYGDMEYEIFWDGNPEGLNEQHQFFIDGDVIYDVWYDQNLISDGIAERFLKTVAINAEPNPAFTSQELAAFAKCKSVIDTVQSGSHHIAWEKYRTSSAGTSGYRVEYYSHEDDWLHKTSLKVGDAGETQYRIMVDGESIYGTTGFDRNTDEKKTDESDVSLPLSYLGEPDLPWLSSFQWDDATVAYVDTLMDQGLETIMLRIDEPFYGYPEETQCYYVNFVFDGSGSFLRVELEAIVFRNNELWTANETETIYSLDPDRIDRNIQSAYDRFHD